jgi:hypothetical protein
MRRRNRKIMVQGQKAVVRRRLRSTRLACVALHPAPPSRRFAELSGEPHGNTGNRENENLSEYYNQKNYGCGLVHLRPLCCM